WPSGPIALKVPDHLPVTFPSAMAKPAKAASNTKHRSIRIGPLLGRHYVDCDGGRHRFVWAWYRAPQFKARWLTVWEWAGRGGAADGPHRRAAQDARVARDARLGLLRLPRHRPAAQRRRAKHESQRERGTRRAA